MCWPAQILIVAQESEDRDKLVKILAESGAETFCYATLLEAESFLSGQSIQAIFAEVHMPDGDFQDLCAEVDRFQRDVPLIALTQKRGRKSCQEMVTFGAFDNLSLPAKRMEIKRVLQSALNAFSTELRREEVVIVATQGIIPAS